MEEAESSKPKEDLSQEEEINQILKDEGSNYIDLDTKIINQLFPKRLDGYYNIFTEIESALRTKDELIQRPIVLEFDESTNRALFMAKWIQYHQEVSQAGSQDFFMPLFQFIGGKNIHIFYILYKVICNLREYYNLSQRVPLLNEKLRKYFGYWLDLVSRTIQKNIGFDGSVFILYENIDQLIERKSKQAYNCKFWVPAELPERVFMLLGSEAGSRNLEYLKGIGCKVIKVRPSEDFREGRRYLMKLAKRISIIAPDYNKMVLDTFACLPEALQENNLFSKLYFQNFYVKTKVDDKDVRMVKVENIQERDLLQLRGVSDIFELLLRIYDTHLQICFNLGKSQNKKPKKHSNMVSGRASYKAVQSNLDKSILDKSIKQKEADADHKSTIVRDSSPAKSPQNQIKLDNSHYSSKGFKQPSKANSQTNKLEHSNTLNKSLNSQLVSASETNLANQNNQTLPQLNLIQEFKEVLIYLALSSKGLTFTEVVNLIGANKENIVKKIFKILDKFLLKINSQYLISDHHLLSVIQANYLSKQEQCDVYHKKIAMMLENGQNNFRRLEEQIHHYMMAKEHFQIKQLLSNIENFLLLFVSQYKYHICHIWDNLISKDFDPVVEYNKSLELFDMHYQPEPSDLFNIIIQISRFLMEISDFEQKNIPEFRHPKIRNRLLTIKGVDITFQAKDKIDQIDKDYFNNKEKYQLDTVNMNEIVISNTDQEVLDHYQERTINYLEDIGLLTEAKRMDLYEGRVKQDKILKEDEKFNVEVPNGREDVKRIFRSLIKAKNDNKLFAEEEKLEPEFLVDDEIDDPLLRSLGINPQTVPQMTKESTHGAFAQTFEIINKNNKDLKKQLNTVPHLEDEIDLMIEPEKEKQYYYYKRWIWLVFPWACQSVTTDNIYSDVIIDCYRSETNYIGIDLEKELTQQAQIIAIEAKLKKKMVLQPKNGNQSHKNSKVSLFKLKSQLSESKTNPAFQSQKEQPASASKQLLPQDQKNHDAQRKVEDVFEHVQMEQQSVVSSSQSGAGPERARYRISDSKRTFQNKEHCMSSTGFQFFMKTKMGSNNTQKGTNKETDTHRQTEIQTQDNFFLTGLNSYEPGMAQHQTGRSQFTKKGNKTVIQSQKLKSAYQERSLSRNPSQNNGLLQQKSSQKLLSLDKLRRTQPIIWSSFVNSQFDRKQNNNIRNIPIDQMMAKTLIEVDGDIKFEGVLRSMQQAVEFKSSKEIEMMERKNNKLKAALNAILYKKKGFVNHLNEILKTMEKYEEMTSEDVLDFRTRKLNELVKQINKTQQNFKVNNKQENRLRKIITICNANKDMNEEWIRQLNFYISNMSKMIGFQKKYIEDSDSEISDIKRLIQEYYESYTLKNTHMKHILGMVKKSYLQQGAYDNAFLQMDRLKPELQIKDIDRLSTLAYDSSYVRVLQGQELNSRKVMQIQQGSFYYKQEEQFLKKNKADNKQRLMKYSDSFALQQQRQVQGIQFQDEQQQQQEKGNSQFLRQYSQNDEVINIKEGQELMMSRTQRSAANNSNSRKMLQLQQQQQQNYEEGSGSQGGPVNIQGYSILKQGSSKSLSKGKASLSKKTQMMIRKQSLILQDSLKLLGDQYEFVQLMFNDDYEKIEAYEDMVSQCKKKFVIQTDGDGDDELQESEIVEFQDEDKIEIDHQNKNDKLKDSINLKQSVLQENKQQGLIQSQRVEPSQSQLTAQNSRATSSQQPSIKHSSIQQNQQNLQNQSKSLKNSQYKSLNDSQQELKGSKLIEEHRAPAQYNEPIPKLDSSIKNLNTINLKKQKKLKAFLEKQITQQEIMKSKEELKDRQVFLKERLFELNKQRDLHKELSKKTDENFMKAKREEHAELQKALKQKNEQKQILQKQTQIRKEILSKLKLGACNLSSTLLGGFDEQLQLYEQESPLLFEEIHEALAYFRQGLQAKLSAEQFQGLKRGTLNISDMVSKQHFKDVFDGSLNYQTMQSDQCFQDGQRETGLKSSKQQQGASNNEIYKMDILKTNQSPERFDTN